MKAKKYLLKIVTESISRIGVEIPKELEVNLERPKQIEHGDFSTNIAMQLTRFAKKPPRSIAEDLVKNIQFDQAMIEDISIAGPGFINFKFGWGYYREQLSNLIELDEDFGKSDFGNKQKIQIEFVSANPTGPLNVVSARAATIGDVMINMYNAVGYDAEREYYINDAGRQIALLGASVSSRYMAIFGRDEPFPEDGYHGDYIGDIAKMVADEMGDAYTSLSVAERAEKLGQAALQFMIKSHQEIMEEYGVTFDNWFHESSLRETNAHQQILDYFKQNDLSYEQDGAIWFRSEQYGDEKDRVLVTSDGKPTYFLIDISYHKNKFDRGFSVIYDLWGPDHHGYIPRMKAAIEALGYDPDNFKVEIIQQVNLLRAGEVIKMSKRAGKIIEMREVIDEVGVDVARFFFINRRISSHLDFDIDLAKKQSDENPVYYLQYAHARICSILRFAEENDIDISAEPNLNYLQEKEELELVKGLLQYPEVLISCVRGFEPHVLPTYLQNMAGLFHTFYHHHRVVTNDNALTLARLTLCKATRIVLQNGLKILGITAPEKM